MGWNTGSLEKLRPLRPSTVRIDASLQDANPAKDVLDLGPLPDKVAAVRAIGAEPGLLDGRHGDLARVRRLPVTANGADLTLPPQSVAWLRLASCTTDEAVRGSP